MSTIVNAKNSESTDAASDRHTLDADGGYRIRQYDTAPAFCSFLPGVAGPDGVPLWCMYVNRAQAVVSFGVQDKDHAIAEFLPATWAYQLVGVQGFRTFCKIDGCYYEPFRETAARPAWLTRTMQISTDSLALTETNEKHGLTVAVRYFALANLPLAGLVRRVQIRNDSDAAIQLHMLDGLPLILPAGFTDEGMKTLRHINEAYASVRRACPHVPFFASKVVAHDEPEVVEVTQGNFYAAWIARGDEFAPVEPYVDPHVIFGAGHDLVTPRRFIENQHLPREAQIWENRLPCAMTPLEAVLEAGESIELIALAGFAPHDEMLATFLEPFDERARFDAAEAESRRCVDEIVAPALASSGVPELDAYTRQNYLDNILRGGVPRLFPSKDGPTLLHLYSRRHGDLERDYNYFTLPGHPLSSGAGNYRDVCQNRRHDVWFHPEIADHEIRAFTELLQADGYNPLSVDGYRWTLPADEAAARLCPSDDPVAVELFTKLVRREFQPGELLQWAREQGVSLPDTAAWIDSILARCKRKLVAHGHEGGFWIDHWTYITDLLEAYAAIYPDRVASMLTDNADIGWFDEGAIVQPRAARYVARPSGPLQLNAVTDAPPAARPLPNVTVFGKLCALLAIKAVSFDHAGRGIEMEAGRPGWNDSLNGLPGLFGSSSGEAAEVGRLARWLRAQLQTCPDTAFPVIVADLIEQVVANLARPDYDWSLAAEIREQFRTRVRENAGDRTREVAGEALTELLARVERRALDAIERSVDAHTGLLHTYYRNRPTLARSTERSPDKERRPLADRIKGFESEPLPLFLEGQVHWLRFPRDADSPADIHQAVRRSPLFDTELAMYKLNECLDACPPEIGRARTFTRGWFENESIWLHMSYKYLLELLRAGLHAEFFADAATMLVPMMNPEIYGRSILENCSFLGSSANPDPATRGRGFIARLSGSTAEFIHIWHLLTAGPQPFFVEDGELRFRLEPTLPGAWFAEAARQLTWRGRTIDLPANSFACALFGKTLLVYENARRRDTFGPDAVRPAAYAIDNLDPIREPHIGPAIAKRIREQAIERITVTLE